MADSQAVFRQHGEKLKHAVAAGHIVLYCTEYAMHNHI